MYKIDFINNGCVIFLTLSAIKRHITVNYILYIMKKLRLRTLSQVATGQSLSPSLFW